jgi:hypothetical protein
MKMVITNKTQLKEFYKNLYKKEDLCLEELDYIDQEAVGLGKLTLEVEFDDETKKLLKVKRIKNST